MVNKVVIIEDHIEFRESICYILESNSDYKCIGKYSSVEEALENITEADVILLDINLPGMTGIEGIPKLKEKLPSCAVIILTVIDDNKNVFNAILAGADGYLLKKTTPLRILQAIDDARNGGSPMSPSIAKQTINFFKQYAPRNIPEYSLSEREKEILSLLVNGFNNDEISTKLFISVQTVRNHIRHIYEKLHVHSKSQAVAKAIKENIVS